MNNEIWNYTGKPGSEWSDEEICDFYDRNPNLSILTYAGMLGLTGGEVKQILGITWSIESRTEYCNRMGFDM